MPKSKIFTRTLLALGLAAAAVVAHAQAAEPKVLNVYNWSDYIADDTIKNFEKETGIKVRYDNYDANEILQAKLVAGRSGYDIVVPSAHFAKTQIAGGLYQKLDRAQLTNWGNLDPALLEKLADIDPGNEHLVTWMWGYVTVGINTAKVKAALGATPMPANPWSLIFDPQYAGKLKGCGINVLDSASEVMPVAMIYAGKPPYSKTAKDYDAAREVLMKARPNVTRFSSSGYINDLAAGQLCVVMGYSGDINIARQRAIDGQERPRHPGPDPAHRRDAVLRHHGHPQGRQEREERAPVHQLHPAPRGARVADEQGLLRQPQPGSKKFVKKEVADNPTVFLSADDLKKLTSPDAVPQDIRRVQTRIFTSFKANTK